MASEGQLKRLQAQRRLRLICSFLKYLHRKPCLYLFVNNDKLNRIQLVALDVGIPLIDSIYDHKYSPGNTLSLHRCLCELTNQSNTLDLALQALCLLQIANRRRDERLEMESMLMNNRALKALLAQLRAAADAKTAYTTEILAAALCLKTCEVCNLTFLAYLTSSI